MILINYYVCLQYFDVLITLLQLNQSTLLQGHIFGALKAFVHSYSGVLFKGSSYHCGALCYQVNT